MPYRASQPPTGRPPNRAPTHARPRGGPYREHTGACASVHPEIAWLITRTTGGAERKRRPSRHAPARCREGETQPRGADPGLKAAAGLFRVLGRTGPESRLNSGLLVLGRTSWLCAQSPESSGFLIIIKPQIFTNTTSTPVALPQALLETSFR